jgi:hypothetical protein
VRKTQFSYVDAMTTGCPLLSVSSKMLSVYRSEARSSQRLDSIRCCPGHSLRIAQA